MHASAVPPSARSRALPSLGSVCTAPQGWGWHTLRLQRRPHRDAAEPAQRHASPRPSITRSATTGAARDERFSDGVPSQRPARDGRTIRRPAGRTRPCLRVASGLQHRGELQVLEEVSLGPPASWRRHGARCRWREEDGRGSVWVPLLSGCGAARDSRKRFAECSPQSSRLMRHLAPALSRRPFRGGRCLVSSEEVVRRLLPRRQGPPRRQRRRTRRRAPSRPAAPPSARMASPRGSAAAAPTPRCVSDWALGRPAGQAEPRGPARITSSYLLHLWGARSCACRSSETRAWPREVRRGAGCAQETSPTRHIGAVLSGRVHLVTCSSLPLSAGEEHPYCQALIEAHKACLRVEGFNVRARRVVAHPPGPQCADQHGPSLECVVGPVLPAQV